MTSRMKSSRGSHFLFIYVFLVVLCLRGSWAFPSDSEWGVLSSRDVQASHFGGFTCWGARALDVTSSVVAARGQAGFSSYGAGA